MDEFVNMTPHPVNVHLDDGRVMIIPPSGIVPRVQQTQEIAGLTPSGVKLYRTTFGNVEVPTWPDACYIIVSALYATAYRAQHGPGGPLLVVPTDPVRDENGNIRGCRGFSIV